MIPVSVITSQGAAKRKCRAAFSALILVCAFLSASPPEYGPPHAVPGVSGSVACLLQQVLFVQPAFGAERKDKQEPAQDKTEGTRTRQENSVNLDDTGDLEDSGTQEMKKQKRRADLDDSMEELLPLSPDEIRRFMERQDEADSAVSPDPAAMKTRVVSLPCTQQKSPHVVHLAAGYSSAIMFQDVTGAPWPVLTAIFRNAEPFSVSGPHRDDTGGKEKSGQASEQNSRHSHIVTVLPLKAHASGSLVLTLQDAVYPVLLHLVSAGSRGRGRVSDALTVIRLDGQGPSARPPAIGPRPETASEELLSLVHGIVPEKARRIRTVPQIPGLALWRCKDRLMVRTPYEAIWPAWLSCAGGEGLKVYSMPVTPSIVLSIDGKAVQVRISGSPEAVP